MYDASIFIEPLKISIQLCLISGIKPTSSSSQANICSHLRPKGWWEENNSLVPEFVSGSCMSPVAHLLNDLLTDLTPYHILGSVRTEPGEPTPSSCAPASCSECPGAFLPGQRYFQRGRLTDDSLDFTIPQSSFRTAVKRWTWWFLSTVGLPQAPNAVLESHSIGSYVFFATFLFWLTPSFFQYHFIGCLLLRWTL